MKINCQRDFLVFFFTLFIMVISTSAHASITMSGTRIIYDGGSKSAEIQLKNNDSFPYVISTWFDSGNMDDTPEQGKSIPFTVTPPVFRVQPDSGQVVRVVYTGAKKLPQDRESVFWFNFLQVPPSNLAAANAGKQNKILVMLRNRVKLFYRPKGLSGDPQKMLQNLNVSALSAGTKAGITIANNQPYYVTITQLRLNTSSGPVILKADMIPPFEKANFFYPTTKKQPARSVTVTLVNDQGARISETYPL